MRSRECHQARKPPPNASPAPIVSTTSVGWAGMSVSAVGRDDGGAARPAGEQDRLRPVAEELAPGLFGRQAGPQPGEVLLADLHDVGALQHAVQARTVGRLVVDRLRAAVGVQDDHRAAGEALDDRLERGRERLEHEPERADVQRRRVPRQRGERLLGAQAGGGGAAGVEAPARGALGVEARERERRRIARAHDAAGVDAVLGEHPLVRRPEPVGRQPPEVRHRPPEPPERPRDVERPAAGVPVELAPGTRDEVVQRFAGDEDRTRHAASVPHAQAASSGASSAAVSAGRSKMSP